MCPIEYKGYRAEIEIDFEDNCIYASVANAPGLYLTAEGKTPGEARNAFERIVDDYLESAKASGWDVIAPTSVSSREAAQSA